MIAGEPFSDRPRSVCRVIGALLRAYNDLSPDSRRQDLYRCASDVIGSRASTDVEALRVEHCIEVIGELSTMRARSPLWRLRSPSPSRLVPMIETTRPDQPVEEFLYGMARVLRAGGKRGHARALKLVDELVAIGRAQPSTSPIARAFATASEREETSSLR